MANSMKQKMQRKALDLASPTDTPGWTNALGILILVLVFLGIFISFIAPKDNPETQTNSAAIQEQRQRDYSGDKPEQGQQTLPNAQSTTRTTEENLPVAGTTKIPSTAGTIYDVQTASAQQARQACLSTYKPELVEKVNWAGTPDTTGNIADPTATVEAIKLQAAPTETATDYVLTMQTVDGPATCSAKTVNSNGSWAVTPFNG